MLEKSLDVRGGETKTFKIYDWSASHGRMDRELLVQTYSFNYRKRALGAEGKLQFDNWMKPVLICPFFQLGGYRKIDWFHSNGYWWWKRKNWFTIVWSVEFWKTFTEQKVAAVIFISSTSVQRVGYLSKSKICRMAGGEQTQKKRKKQFTVPLYSPRGLAHRLWWMMMKYRVLFRFGMAKKKLTRIGRHFPFGMVSTGYYPGKVINNTNRIDLLSRGEPTEGSHGKLDDPPRDCPVFLFVP